MEENFLSSADWVTAVATFFIAILTACLAYDSWKLRRGGINPLVVAYLRPHETHYNLLQLHISNIGSGPAFDVRFKITPSDQFDPWNIFAPKESSAPLNVLPQGDSIVLTFGSAIDLFKVDPLPVFCLSTSYKNVLGQCVHSNSVLDLRSFEGFHGPPTSAIEDMSRTFKKIDSNLADIRIIVKKGLNYLIKNLGTQNDGKS